jgi:hypothetical protein
MRAPRKADAARVADPVLRLSVYWRKTLGNLFLINSKYFKPDMILSQE